MRQRHGAVRGDQLQQPNIFSYELGEDECCHCWFCDHYKVKLYVYVPFALSII